MSEIFNLFQIILTVFAFIGLFAIPATAYATIKSIIHKHPYRDYAIMFVISIISIPAIYILYRLLVQVRGY